MKRVLVALAAIALIAVAGTAISMRMIGDDPAVWHVDPAVTARTGHPNDYLVAPEGATAAKSDRVSGVHTVPPKELLFLFDAVARPSRNTQIVAGSVEDLHVTYVQRSTLLGFPDYISVKAVPVEGGSALIIWSRSRYGYGDLGVNKKRVDGWLAQIGGTG